MKVHLLIPALFGLLSAVAAQAKLDQASCPDKDLSARFGPVRDQGYENACAAEVTADLIGYVQGLIPPEQVSMFDVAVTLATLELNGLKPDDTALNLEQSLYPRRLYLPHLARRQRDRQGSIPSRGSDITAFARLGSLALGLSDLDIRTRSVLYQAFDFLPFLITPYAYQLGGGLCTERQLPSEGSSLAVGSGAFIENQIRSILKRPLDPNHDLMVQRRAAYLNAEFSSPHRFDPRMKRAQLSRELNRQAMARVKAAVDQACEPRRPMRPMQYGAINVVPGPNSEATATIAGGLNEDMPAGISYDPRFAQTNEPAPKEIKSTHASIALGSRWNQQSQSCMFKMRDSGGTTCDYENASVKSRCRGGYVWLTEDEINQSTTNLFFLLAK